MTTRGRKDAEVRTGLLLIGHGSRATDATRVLAEVAAALRRHFRRFIVEAAFLELNQPDVATGIDQLVAQGAARILFVPYSPYLDGQVGRELPEHIGAAKARHPGLEIRIAPHLGYDARLVEVCADRITRALRDGRWT